MRTDRPLLEDLLEAIEETLACTPAGRDEFDADKFLRSHLLRQLQIIGEVAWRLSPDLKESHAAVPWKQIAGMRHAIVHDYFEVDWNEVYQVVIRDIPMLKAPIEAILNCLPPEER
ncbi:MAG: DUF86 domain-containing protein [Planctomycetes bacterium]|nr:DUF86 domain-containing protein [Planctomycetota bacterium]